MNAPSLLAKDPQIAAEVRSPSHRATCRHCGLPAPRDNDFCCAGCDYVFQLINDSGLAGYYRIKDEVTSPADVALLPARENAWLVEAQAEAEKASDTAVATMRLDVQGISCVGCVWLIEKLFQKQPGAGRIAINAQLGQAELVWMRGTFDAANFAAELQRFNYLLSAASEERTSAPENHPLVKKIGLCAAFTMNVMLFTFPSYFGMKPTDEYARLFGTLSLALATLSLLTGGTYFIGKAIRGLRLRTLSIDVPISLGIVGAYSGSFVGWLLGFERLVYFDFVSAFILLMLIGRWAQLEAVERNRRRLLAQQPVPPAISVLSKNGWTRRAPDQLRAGMRFSIPSNQVVPVEAELISDRLSAGMAWINGESESRIFSKGETVPSGAINLMGGEAHFEAKEAYGNSLLALLLRPVKQKAHGNPWIEKIVKAYLAAILAVAGFAGVYWYYSSGDLLRTYYVVTAVLVVSCPCAIGLAFPLVDEIATVALRKKGVFVRTEDLWPRLAKVKTLVFDKTGTLTNEVPRLLRPEQIAGLSFTARNVLACLVRSNPHPVASGLRGAGAGSVTEMRIHAEVREEVGEGLELVHEGSEWRLGREKWATAESSGKSLSRSGAGVVLSKNRIEQTRFEFREALRADVPEEMQNLQRRGLNVVVLSGDHEDKVRRVVEGLGLRKEAGYAGMTPSSKADWIRNHGRGSALILGDGANDSLAFNEAYCRGTPVVHRGVLSAKADFYYLGQGIAGIRALFEMDDRRRRTQGWLLVFSVSYNLLAVGLAVCGRMHPLLAAILMPASSLTTLGIVGLGMRRSFSRTYVSSDHR